MLYAQWRFRGRDPAAVWRGAGGVEPPAPWPWRHEAFLTACANHAAEREADLLSIVEAFTTKKKG